MCLSRASKSKQTQRVWGSENLHETRELFRHSDKVTVWCTLASDRVIGSFYFDEPIVTGEIYLHLLNTLSIPILPNTPSHIIFQQDGAQLHHSLAVRELLDSKMQKFLDWKRRSHQLASSFPWPYSFSLFIVRICETQSSQDQINQYKTVDAKSNISFRSIPSDMLQNIWQNIKLTFYCFKK